MLKLALGFIFTATLLVFPKMIQSGLQPASCMYRVKTPSFDVQIYSSLFLYSSGTVMHIS